MQGLEAPAQLKTQVYPPYPQFCIPRFTQQWIVQSWAFATEKNPQVYRFLQVKPMLSKGQLYYPSNHFSKI